MFDLSNGDLVDFFLSFIDFHVKYGHGHLFQAIDDDKCISRMASMRATATIHQ